MAETLGSLCDKLTIVKLKQYHSQDSIRLESLAIQEKQLCDEINNYIWDAIGGKIPLENLFFLPIKYIKRKGNEILRISGSISGIFSELSKINCDLWHEQEKVYEFETVPSDKKDIVVKQLALLNLQRTQCIDLIDKKFQEMVIKKR